MCVCPDLPATSLELRTATPPLPCNLIRNPPRIIALAVEDLRSRYADRPDPDRLLDDEFTMRELRLAHEAVAGQSLQRDWFRRTMEPQLVPTGTVAGGTRGGRPAELFRQRL